MDGQLKSPDGAQRHLCHLSWEDCGSPSLIVFEPRYRRGGPMDTSSVSSGDGKALPR